MAKTMSSRTVDELLASKGIYLDSVRKMADGGFTGRKSFFYRQGNSAEKIAERIKAAIPGVEILEAYDEWKAWPKTSYFVVRFQLPEGI
jgi:hypothetical protein